MLRGGLWGAALLAVAIGTAGCTHMDRPQADAAPPPAEPSATAADIGIPPIRYTSRTLANGLRVYAIRDTTSPNVSVQVWYDVGSTTNDPIRSASAQSSRWR